MERKNLKFNSDMTDKLKDIGSPGFGLRPLGVRKTMVSPIGLAGGTFAINEPTVEAYRYGVERGINLFFWDPMFKRMTEALLELSDEKRASLFIYAASSFGGPRLIRKAILKRLKILKLDRLSGFILGWVRSDYRVRNSVTDELRKLKEEGLCENIGLSIHKRSRAFELYKKNIFDLFMLRYNAAHKGLERDFLDRLDPDNLPVVIGYTTTRWGKLLKKPPGWNGSIPRPGDLYRFSLSHPRINAVLMSPQNTEQLKDNLDVLSEGPLTFEEDESIRKFGDAVYSSKSKILGDLFEHSART